VEPGRGEDVRFRPAIGTHAMGGRSGDPPLFVAPVLPFGRSCSRSRRRLWGDLRRRGNREASSSDAKMLLKSFRENTSSLPREAVPRRSRRKDLYATFRRPIFEPTSEYSNAIPRKELRNPEREEERLVSGSSRKGTSGRLLRHVTPAASTTWVPVFPKALFRNLLDEFGSVAGSRGLQGTGRCCLG